MACRCLLVVLPLALADSCLDHLNSLRAQHGLNALVLNPEKQSCVNWQAETDSTDDSPHETAGKCGEASFPDPDGSGWSIIGQCEAQGQSSCEEAIDDYYSEGTSGGHYKVIMGPVKSMTWTETSYQGQFKTWYTHDFFDYVPGPNPSPSPSPSPSYYKTITPQSNTKLCLDLPGDDSSDGNPVWLWDCNGQESQRWVFDNWQIRFGADESKCLDAGSMQDGFHLWLWSCNGVAQQQWGYDESASRIYLANTAMCMDFDWNDQANGCKVQAWDCNGHTNQWWSLWNINLNETEGQRLPITV